MPDRPQQQTPNTAVSRGRWSVDADGTQVEDHRTAARPAWAAPKTGDRR